MNKQQIKHELLIYLKRNNGATFCDIEVLFEKIGFDFQGDLKVVSGINEAVILWDGRNSEACDVITEMSGEGLIEPVTCNVLLYLVFGELLKLPVLRFQDMKRVKRPHWLPVTFNARK